MSETQKPFKNRLWQTAAIASVAASLVAACGEDTKAQDSDPAAANVHEAIEREKQEIDKLGTHQLYKGEFGKTGLTLDVRSDGEGVTFHADRLETSLRTAYQLATEILKPEDIKLFADAQKAIFENGALDSKTVPIVIASDPATCYKDGAFVPANAQPISQNTSCGDIAEAFGFTDMVALQDSSGQLDIKHTWVHIAPAAINGKTQVDRQGEIVYELTPDQAAHAMIVHEGLHFLRRLMNGQRPAYEEAMVTVVEEAFVREHILGPSPLPSPIEYQPAA